MLFNFNEASSRAKESTYDVCVSGAGPAGITLARKLAASGKKVVLLEGGGLAYSDESQDHYRGTNIGRQIWALDTGRLRYFGGTSNHWSGLCAVLDELTFEKHNGPGLPGWPISRQEILRHLPEATEILDISGADFSPKKEPGFDTPWFAHYSAAESPPTRFGEKYEADIKQSELIDCFYNASAVDLKLSENGRHVICVTVQGNKNNKVEVKANNYVLALGGIENARFLLNANKQMPAGVGNQHGWVGRCFSESLFVQLGRFIVTDAGFWQGGSRRLVPTPALIQRYDIGNGAVDLSPNVPTKNLVNYGRLRIIKDFLRETGCASPTLRSLASNVVDFNCAGDGLIQTLLEQEPNPDSRVTLGNDVDSFGLRRAVLNWQLQEKDLRTIRTIAIEMAKEMARLNLARIQLSPYILDKSLDIDALNGHGHHMGTTRMSSDPQYGVVDGNCQVHGVGNLYVAGSSVFPRCGGKNPTLTIVLLALRMGERLSSQT